MPLDQSQWQIDILAADRTAAAFASVGRRMRDMERAFTAGARANATQIQSIVDSVVRSSTDPTAIVQKQAAGFAALAASQTLLGKVNAQALQQFGALRVETDAGAKSLAAMNVAASAASGGGGGLARLAPALALASAAWATWNAGMKAGALVDQAEQLGLTVDQLQAYRGAAMQVGVSNEQLDSSILSLTKAMGAANGGSAEAIAKFDKLGVKLLDSRGELRGVADVMPEVARGLLGIGSETERNALSMEIFGKSGARMKTLLGDMAKGSEALVESARQQRTIVGTDVAEAWNKLDTQLKITTATTETALAALGAPVATWALEKVDAILKSVLGNLDRIADLEKRAPQIARGADVKSLEEQLAVQKQLLAINPSNKMAQASVAGIERRIAEARSDLLALAVTADVSGDNHGKLLPMLPPPGTTGTGGVSQPTAKTGGGSGGGGGSPIDRQREESDRLYKEILDNIEKVRKAGEGMTDRYGSGMETATRRTAELNEMLAMGFIDVDTYAAAMRDVNRAAEDQNRAFVGAKGGFDAYLAGFDQGIADLQRANSEFELGRKAVDFLGESIDSLAGISGKSFDQVAINFALMVAKMEAARAGSQLWSALGGFSGILGMLGLGGGGGGFASGGGITGGEFGAGFGDFFAGLPKLAGGGDFDGAAIVGEKGPELVVGRGSVYNRDQVRGLGGNVVNVYQTIHVGEFVTTTQYRQGLRVVEQSARQGAEAAIVAKGRAGDPRLAEALR